MSVIRGMYLADLEQNPAGACTHTHSLSLSHSCPVHPFPITFQHCDRRGNTTHKGSSATFRKKLRHFLQVCSECLSLVKINLFYYDQVMFYIPSDFTSLGNVGHVTLFKQLFCIKPVCFGLAVKGAQCSSFCLCVGLMASALVGVGGRISLG